MCIGVFCSLQLFHSLKRPFHRYNSLLLRIPILRTEPVILFALHNADLAHRIHAAACPIAKLGIIGVWFIACSTDSRRHAARDQRGCTQITPLFIKNTSCL